MKFKKDKTTHYILINNEWYFLCVCENCGEVHAVHDGFGYCISVDWKIECCNNPNAENQLIWRLWTDADYLDTYEMELIRGSYFAKQGQHDHRNIVINESAITTLGLADPIGQKVIDIDRVEYTIIGVVKDFHFESLHYKIKPLIIHCFRPSAGGRYISLRVTPDNISSIIHSAKNTWKKFAGNQSFEYEFFDTQFAKIYKNEQRTGNVFFAFALLAILIASLGLLGLTAFITVQRTKEIGIRKVLGASMTNILTTLYKQFFRWILISIIIALPIAYFVMRYWLQIFAYRVTIGVEMFFLSAVIAILVAVFTVSYQSIKSASANPGDSLKYE